MTDLATNPDALASEEALEDALDAFLAGTFEDLDEPPEDDAGADRLLGALAAVQRRRQRAVAVATARIQAVRAWLDEVGGPLDQREAQLLDLLDGWTRAQYRATGRKTFKLPTGELRLRPLRQRTVLDPNLSTAELADAVRPVLPSAVRDLGEDVPVSAVAAGAEPGQPLPDWPDVPEGYVAHQAVVAGDDDSGFTVVPGVAFLVPVSGADGQTFKAVPA